MTTTKHTPKAPAFLFRVVRGRNLAILLAALERAHQRAARQRLLVKGARS